MEVSRMAIRISPGCKPDEQATPQCRWVVSGKQLKGAMMANKKAVKQEEAATVEPVVVTAFKGFDKDMKCRGFQFEVGKTYEHKGKVEACSSGFHACEYPLDVLGYYGPADGNKFAIVEQSGKFSRYSDDTKVASSSITVKAEINLPGLITAAFEYVRQHCNPVNDQHSTGYSSASSSTGYSSASSSTGYSSASSSTGYRSASSSTGDSSASSSTGDRSASSSTGYSSASSSTGYRSASLSTGSYSTSEIKANDGNTLQHAVAIATGYQSKARSPIGSAIVCVYRNKEGHILHIKAAKVGETINGITIKPDVFYTLNESGDFTEE